MKMSAQILDFKRDFTPFLQEKTRQMIKVVTDTEIIECSGVILSQHSLALKKLIEEDDELFLLGYNSVLDILTILYGGSVVLTLDNCLEMIKFGWEFGVPNIADQAFNFMESVADKSNIIHVARLCLTAMKLSKFYDVKIEEDVFWPCENVIANLNSDDLEEFVRSLLPVEIVHMFRNKMIMARVIDPLSEQINGDNVQEIISVLREIDYPDLVVSASPCSETDAALFFGAIQEHGIPPGSATFLLNLKKMVFREIESSSIASQSSRPNIMSIFKNWKTYDLNQMMWVCEHGMKSFWLMETILSWVSHFRPAIWAVKRLCRFIDTKHITLDYAGHAASILMNLGYYDLSFDREIGTRSSNLQQLHQVKEVTEIRTKIANVATNAGSLISVSEKQMIFNCSRVSNTWSCVKGSTIAISSVPDNIPSIKCCMKRQSGTKVSMIQKLDSYCVYAKSADGKHVPFYTDPKWAAHMEYDLRSVKLTIPFPCDETSSHAFLPKRAKTS